MRKTSIFGFVFVLSGCASPGHVQFYDQVAPTTYEPTESVMVFEYQNVKINEVYELLYSDYMIIGKSGFEGPYEAPDRAKSYARSIGADIFISAAQFAETRTSILNLTTPTTTTTSFSGITGTSSFSGSATTYGTTTTPIPIVVNRYDQFGIYLKNVNKIQPVWEKQRTDFVLTDDIGLSGQWENDNYRVDIRLSGNDYVAFIEEVIGGDKSWSKDQLKMYFGVESGVGIYLMGSKAPTPASFEVNKFGHLEIRLITDGQVFSFSKQNEGE